MRARAFEFSERRVKQRRWFVVGGVVLVLAVLWTAVFSPLRDQEWPGLAILGLGMIAYGTVRPKGTPRTAREPDVSPHALFTVGLLLVASRFWIRSIWPLGLLRWTVEGMALAFLLQAHRIATDEQAKGRTGGEMPRRAPGEFNLPL